MNPMRRVGVAVVLVVMGAMLFASTPARAAENWGIIQLANTGDEAQASGQTSLTRVEYVLYLPFWSDGYKWYAYTGKLSVKCQNLMPGTTYWTPAGTFQANRKGEGSVSANVRFEVGWDDFFWGSVDPYWVLVEPYVVDVARLDADGLRTTVLSGYFVPPGCEYTPPDWYYLLVGNGELP